MSYEREVKLRLAVRTALEAIEIEGVGTYDPEADLIKLIETTAELFDGLDPTDAEIMDALRANEPVLYVATINMLVDGYIAEVEDTNDFENDERECGCSPASGPCGSCLEAIAREEALREEDEIVPDDDIEFE